MLLRALAAAAVALLPGLAQAAEFPDDARIRSILQQRVERDRRAVGIVAAVADASGRRIVAYGTVDGAGTAPVAADTLFEIGSITKVFTGLLLADMAVRGEVKLDDPVKGLLPAPGKMPRIAGREVTLADLSSHASGLPRVPPDLHAKDPANPYRDYTAAHLYEDLARFPDAAKVPPAGERYSNLGVGLLGHVLALRAGRDYEALLRERVLEPLGLRDTRITLDASQRARLATPHTETLARAAPWDLPTLAGAGALRATAADLLAFAEQSLGLKPSALEAAMALQQKPIDTGFALGWIVRGYRLFHEGGTGGSSSFIAIDTKEKRAVVVLSNSSNSIGDIGAHLLDPDFALREQQPPKVRAEVALADPASFDALAGRYQLAPNFVLAFTREGSRYFTQATGQQRLEIFPSSEDSFFLKDVEASVTFVRDAGGRVVAVLLDQGGRVQRAERQAP